MEEGYKGTITELRPKLRKHLSVLSYQEQDEVISLLKPLLEKAEPPLIEGEVRHVDRGLNEYYAIRKSDIDLLEKAVVVLTPLLGTISAIPPAVVPTSVGVIAALVVLLFQYKRKRIELDEKQAIVLKALKKAPKQGWPVKVLANNLPINPWLEENEILSVLTSLKSVIREGDGIKLALVAEEENLWRAIDV